MSELASLVVDGDRRALARAITLVESTRPDHRAEAEALLAEVLPHVGGAVRVGISGAPGSGPRVSSGVSTNAVGVSPKSPCGNRVPAVGPRHCRKRGWKSLPLETGRARNRAIGKLMLRALNDG